MNLYKHVRGDNAGFRRFVDEELPQKIYGIKKGIRMACSEKDKQFPEVNIAAARTPGITALIFIFQ